jgi:hypothetical protein
LIVDNYGATTFDESTTASSASAKDDLQPRGLSDRTIVIIASAITAAVILVIVIETIHCIRRRRRRQARQAKDKQQQDIEKSLQRARPPVLALDTDIPRVNEQQRSAGSRIVAPILPVQTDIPPVSIVHVRSAPSAVHGPSVCVIGLGQSRGRSATRNPIGAHPPGIAGRGISRPTNRIGRFEEVGLQKPTQVYNPHSVKDAASSIAVSDETQSSIK